MKAAIRTTYGSPEQIIRIERIEQPSPKANEVLIKVHATTVNRTGYAVATGTPFIMRFFTGLFRPKIAITGTDFAGEIEAIGEHVTQFKVGDKVFGFYDEGLASHAEYMTFPEDGNILTMPENISFEIAVASLEGAHYSFNFLNKVNIEATDKILINGATGAIGSATLQFLKYKGIEVTAVGNTKNLDLLKSLGADEVIDYMTTDFTKSDKKYAFILDAVGKSSFGKCKHMLEPKGIYISSELGWGAQNIFYALSTPLFGKKKVIFPIPTDVKRSMQFIKQLLEEEKFKPVIDRSYPLEQISEAFNYVNTGQKTGNVIINIK